MEDLGGDRNKTYDWVCKKQVTGVVCCAVYWIYLLRIVTSGEVCICVRGCVYVWIL